MDKRTNLIKKFNAFKNAYNDLINAEGVEDIINDNSEIYPFKTSFDELEINEWVNSINNDLDLHYIECDRCGELKHTDLIGEYGDQYICEDCKK